MIAPLQQISDKLLRAYLRTFRKWSRFVPWLARDDGSARRHAGTLIDLFVTILMRKDRLSARDADAALDILRYSFPELEHRWLAARFERSMKVTFSLDEVLAAAANGYDEAQRMATAIEVLSLMKNTGDEELIRDMFERITFGLELPGMAAHLVELLSVPGTEAQEPAFSVSFGTDPATEVLLPETEEGARFRLIRCSRLVMVVNDGTVPFVVRGRKLAPGSMTPLTVGQIVSLGNSSLSYEDFSFFLEVKRTGKRQTYYAVLENGSLQLTRFRNRSSEMRLQMGLSCRVEVLRADVALEYAEGLRAGQGDVIDLAYFSEFYVNGEGPFSMAEIRDEIDVSGNSFQLDPATRRVRVTNLPEKARKGDMLITPGLAQGVVLEVTFSSTDNTGWLDILESSSPVMVNDRVVRRRQMELHDGDLIRLNAYHALRCQFDAGVLDEEYNAVRSLSVESVSKNFPRAGRVLDNIDFVVKRGEMVCILGPSGSGKSTLLSIMGGHLLPNQGRVRFNDQELYEESSELLSYIAYIPKEDILDASMSVAEHISQAAVIRRSRLSGYDRRRKTNAILKYLGLTHIASRRVGATHERTISDGERTRLNLGLDMTGVADVFLLDEPISGLSSSDAEMVVDSLESLKRDKIVIATMHRPSTSLLNRFDKVLVLDHAGQMAYWGETSGMVRYFRKAAADLGIQVSAEHLRSETADYVFEVLEAPLKWHDRRLRQHPRLWQERFEGFRFRNDMGKTARSGAPRTLYEVSKSRIPGRPKRSPVQLWRLFRIWTMRTFLGRVRSRMGLYTMLLEGPVLAFLIAITLRASSSPEYTFKAALHIPSYIFMSTVVAMFLGLTGAASEILKDAPLIRRESNYRMFVTGYMASKALVLTFLAAIQSALYLLVGNLILEVHDMFLYYWSVMILTAFVGVSLSLIVSYFAKTERAALNMVPLLLIPQVLLAGAMIPFQEMNQFIPWSIHRTDDTGRLKPGRVPLIAEACPLRYAYEMLLVDQATYNIWEIEQQKIQDRLDELKRKPGRLTPGENEERNMLLRSLAAIFSLEASDHDQAKQRIRDVRRAGLSGSLEHFNTLVAELDSAMNDSTLPLPAFFVNDRVLGLYEYAEAQRQSRETLDKPGIFLAHLQPLPFYDDGLKPDDKGYSADNGTMPTVWRDAAILFVMGLVPLVITGLAIKGRLEIRAPRSRRRRRGVR